MVVALPACDLAVVGSDPAVMPYRTSHFAIYYDTTEVTPAEIEQIGVRKEQLLAHVNAYLGEAYRGLIVTVISDTVQRSHAHDYGAEHETVAYALTDRGHEIAHVVTLLLWGSSSCGLLVEGLAVAAEDHGDSTALVRYAQSLTRAADPSAALADDMYYLQSYLHFQAYSVSWIDYPTSGAFVDYMEETYGTELVRDWYCTTVHTATQEFGTALEALTGISTDSLVTRFSDRLAGLLPTP